MAHFTCNALHYVVIRTDNMIYIMHFLVNDNNFSRLIHILYRNNTRCYSTCRQNILISEWRNNENVSRRHCIRMHSKRRVFEFEFLFECCANDCGIIVIFNSFSRELFQKRLQYCLWLGCSQVRKKAIVWYTYLYHYHFESSGP